MTKKWDLPVKVGITWKIDAPTMLLLFNKRKDKAMSEKDFYRSIFEDQFKDFMENMKKDDPEREFYVQITLEFKDDQDDQKNEDQDDQ